MKILLIKESILPSDVVKELQKILGNKYIIFLANIEKSIEVYEV